MYYCRPSSWRARMSRKGEQAQGVIVGFAKGFGGGLATFFVDSDIDTPIAFCVKDQFIAVLFLPLSFHVIQL